MAGLSRWGSAVVLVLLVAAAADAHPVPRRAHDRTIEVRLTAGAVVVQYRLEVDTLTVIHDDLPVFDDQVDTTKFTREDEFYEAYTRCYAPVLANRLLAKLDGKAVAFTCTRRGHRLTDEKGQPLGHLRCDFEFQAPWQPSSGARHEFTFRENNFLLEEGQITLTLVVTPPVELLRKTVPDAAEVQSGDQSKLRNATATFQLSTPSTILPETTPPSPPTTLGGDSPAPGSSQSLLGLLLDTHRGVWVLLALAAVLGAVHALTPGHGKTLVAAYLIGERGTAWHALLLGLITTITHTGAVLILAAVLFWYYRDAAPADVQSALGLIGGLLIGGTGFWLLLRRLAGQADHIHLGGHGHHHHHHHGLTHPLPAGDRRVSTWGLIVLGISGGIIPCWDAIAMLGFAISSQRLWLALPLLLAFSAGLASVLIAIGIGVVYLKGFSDSRWGDGSLIRSLPVVSAAVVTALGLWLCYDSTHREPDARPAAVAHDRP